MPYSSVYGSASHSRRRKADTRSPLPRDDFAFKSMASASPARANLAASRSSSTVKTMALGGTAMSHHRVSEMFDSNQRTRAERPLLPFVTEDRCGSFCRPTCRQSEGELATISVTSDPLSVRISGPQKCCISGLPTRY